VDAWRSESDEEEEETINEEAYDGERPSSCLQRIYIMDADIIHARAHAHQPPRHHHHRS
jgi:hypothetical protein